MKCPVCKSRAHVELDLHADGFAQDARECGDCGAIWTFSADVIKIIKGKVEKKQQFSTDFVCPTCNCMVCNETDLDAFQFHEELYECTACGTICSIAHNHIGVVIDSQIASFLDSTGDLVESYDYNLMR